MTLAPHDILDPLRALLAAVNASAEDLAIDLPERQYVTTGGAVYDCPQVTISANALTSGAAGSAQAGGALASCDPVWTVELEMTVVRNARELPKGPRGTIPPDPTQIEADAFSTMADAACLVRAVMSIVGADRYGSVPTSVQFGEVQGGLTAVVISATVNLWAISL